MSDQTRHVSLDHMVDLVRGHLHATEQQSIHSHMATCTRCAAQMARIERLVTETSTDDSEEVPPHVVARGERLMRQRNAAAQSAPRRHIVAVLRFDSAHVPVALGRRSRPTGARQMVFETGQYDVVVRIKPIGARWAIWGQVLGSVAGGQVVLRGPAPAQAELNSLGELSLPPVPSGAYSLIVRLDDIEISMALDIGA
jgi:anti-sigma factor RsiW